jgi:hypothetical protein
MSQNKNTTSNVISEYKITYETQYSSTRVQNIFEGELKSWHLNKYKEAPSYFVESGEEDVIIIKYITQFVDFIVEIWEEQLVCGVTLCVRTTLKNKNCRTELSEDYNNILKLITNTNDIIIRENTELNERAEEERTELCNIEYAMNRL